MSKWNDEFSTLTQEKLKHYVYCLIDPRNNKIFYVWKWKDNRVFQHAKWIIEKDSLSEKEKVIKEILSEEKKINYFIIRHNLNENEAHLIESTLIDMLTYKSFNFNELADLKNLVQWYNKSLYWLFTNHEIESMYHSKELLKKDIKHNLMVININKTYKSWESLYEATRKSWRINESRLFDIDYFVSEYKWVIRSIFKFDKWDYVLDEKWKKRIIFEWYEITKENDNDNILDLYIFKKFIKKKWDVQVIHYLYKN